MVSIKTVEIPRIQYETRVCPVCDSEFQVRGNAADKNQRLCSRSCATKFRHMKGEMPSPLGTRDWDKNPRLRPKIRPTIRDIVWAAGVYEGEGSVQEQRGGAQIHLGQKDQWVAYRLRDLFGGSVCERKMNNQPFYDWHVSGVRARGALLTMLCFLSPRRQGQILEATAPP